VIATDFRIQDESLESEMVKLVKNLKSNKKRIGLTQINTFELDAYNHPMNDAVRDLINGNDVQTLVYGEKINTTKLLVLDQNILEDKQTYIPTINAKETHVFMGKTVSGEDEIYMD